MKKLFFYITLLVSSLTFGQHETMLVASYQQANSTPVEDTYTPVARVNVGAAITATDGYINWESNNSISQTGVNYSVSGVLGGFADLTGEIFSRDTSIPIYINNTDLNTINKDLRYADDTITYTFPVANDEYEVVIYGVDYETEPKGKITINGELKETDFNWASEFGIKYMAAVKYHVTVTSGEIVVVLEGQTFGGSDYISLMAIEILKKD